MRKHRVRCEARADTKKSIVIAQSEFRLDIWHDDPSGDSRMRRLSKSARAFCCSPPRAVVRRQITPRYLGWNTWPICQKEIFGSLLNLCGCERTGLLLTLKMRRQSRTYALGRRVS